MHYSAKRSLAITCRLCVRDVGGSGSHRLETLETNSTDNPNIFALRSPKATHLLGEEHGKILRRLDIWWGKLCVGASTKAVISLKRVKIQEEEEEEEILFCHNNSKYNI